jgi:hypothetical protein
MTTPAQKRRGMTRSDGETPKEAKLKTGLRGRCFILKNDDGTTKYQGIVHCIVSSAQGDLVLVQYFEALMGEPNTMALVPLADMVEHQQSKGYVFFEDDEHMRFYMEHYQGPRDKRIWEKQWKREEARE